MTTRLKWTAGCLAIAAAAGVVLWAARPAPPTTALSIAARPQLTNGVLLLTLVLSNASTRSLNLVDDAAGNPFWALQAGSDNNSPGDGTIGVGLGRLANTLKLNLAPGACLTDTVRLTNPPPRFRLVAQVRDLGAERRTALLDLLRFLARKARLLKHPRLAYDPVGLQFTPWLAADATLWPTNGPITNTPTSIPNPALHR